MSDDPLAEVVDEQLAITERVLEELAAFRRREPKLPMLPGTGVFEERLRLSNVLNDLADRLIRGIARDPTKLWVLTEFQRSLELVEQEDTEGREHFGMELERIMDILDIESSDGLLACYLGGV
ncbi:DUF4844 domain-containing protein [Massilia sp. ZL223]|uniref:DUF4844 domain-containing protein n=1 Tax=Massilia sp. ZL223 TaxID=2824904 RepID=UPI001B8342F6|nr:DUF4844 domain-containing protein [Massilia sp. ZL223]MBQ5965641.1 DUF4844 domain-containing protein [Massilia sp. ZL223]